MKTPDAPKLPLDAGEHLVGPAKAAPLPPRTPAEDAQTDAVILASATADWVKIAVLIARSTDAARAQSLDLAPPVIAARIYALAESGKLEVLGNMRRWRAAQARLKANPLS